MEASHWTIGPSNYRPTRVRQKNIYERKDNMNALSIPKRYTAKSRNTSALLYSHPFQCTLWISSQHCSCLDWAVLYSRPVSPFTILSPTFKNLLFQFLLHNLFLSYSVFIWTSCICSMVLRVFLFLAYMQLRCNAHASDLSTLGSFYKSWNRRSIAIRSSLPFPVWGEDTTLNQISFIQLDISELSSELSY